MKLTQNLLAWALLLCLPLQVFGQKNAPSNVQLAKTYANYQNTSPSLNHLNFFENMSPQMQLAPQSKMVLTQETADRSGTMHYKYQQFHAGVPVFGSRYILHEKDGVVHSANGRYNPNVSVSTQPNLDAHSALAFAQKDMKARQYAKDVVEPTLCLIDPALPKVSETLRLAYQIELSSTDPVDKRRYFVDANSGRIINHFPLLLKEGVPSTAKTRYYGIQNIITDSIAPQEYVLRDVTRGEGIYIQNWDGGAFYNNSSNWDLTNANKDEVALDAHYCTQEYYDMMLADYNWKGVDGNGKALIANVHAGDFANAFWDGTASSYGDGDCIYGPLTTLEVVGHEFTHGMIDYTSKLIYSDESGAINESLADMFGKMLEYKTDPANFSWDLGHSFLLGPDSEPFRIMDDPNSVQMPAMYKGLFWQDFSDVHTNSSIGNLWFSMIIDGKQGTNEVGTAFNVPALGFDKAGQIVFEVNKSYLTESSTYNDFYSYSVEVAENLYGAGSQEVLAVKEAWKAVGLPVSVNGSFDLTFDSDGFFQNNHCGLGTYIPVSFRVFNAGGTAYDPASNGTVTLSWPGISDYTVALNTPMQPGDYFDIMVDNWLLADQAGSAAVQATIQLNDANPDNNFSTSFYYISEFVANDLELQTSLLFANCFDAERIVAIYLRNASCETIPAGAAMKFKGYDQNSNLIWTSSVFQLPYEVTAQSYGFTSYSFPVLSTPLTFELVYTNDPNTSNNVVSNLSAGANLAITDNYLNTFELNGGQDNYLSFNSGIPPNITYQNSTHIGVTGFYQTPDASLSCLSPEDIFQQGYLVNSLIHACIDFSFSNAPVLEFDLVQFRSELVNSPSSSMFNAKWSGDESGNQIILGQPEGLKQHHTINLPPNFKGALDLQFFCEIGQWDFTPANFSTDDFVLLDNLQLSTATSGTSNPGSVSSIRLSPNPAREITTIQSNEGIQSILVQHANGQTLQNHPVNQSTYDLDLKGLKAGFYFLNVQLDNGNWVVKKLVKMD